MSQNKTSEQPISWFVSSAEPHHAVIVTCPATHLLQPHETATFEVGGQAGEMYEPFPLVQDEGINNRFPIFNEANTEFKGLYRCGGPQTEDFETSYDLEEDMEMCLMHPGETTLEVITYEAMDEDRLRIRRTTRFFRGNGEIFDCEPQDYESIPEDWQELQGPDVVPWQSDVVSLAWQTTERATRHSKRWMMSLEPAQTYEELMGEYPWKAPRMPHVKGVLEEIVPTIDKQALEPINANLPLDEKIETCIICRIEYAEDDFNSTISILPCSEKHTACSECLFEWVEYCSLRKAKCPYCSKLVADPARMVLANPFDINAPIFVNDPVYTRWENFERSCADLDRCNVVSATDAVIVNSNLLAFAWDVMIASAPAPERDAWPHVQTQTPDYALFSAAFHEVITQHNGQTMPISHLHWLIKTQLNIESKHKMITSGSYKLLSPETLDAILTSEIPVPMRKAFEEFVERSLGRVLGFVVVRQCVAENHKLVGMGGGLGGHMHGDRMYYRLGQ